MMELFFDKAKNNWVIKDEAGVLVLSDTDFMNMKTSGQSPLLLKLYDAARKEKKDRGVF
ncbi:hypothetical protein ACFLRF_00525 [Candidatus Altiarchaeota archaeon]